MARVGFDIDNNIKAIKVRKMLYSKRWLFWLIMCIINTHIWKTRTKVVGKQKRISSEAVGKNIFPDLRRRKQKNNSPLPWDLLNI